MNDQNRLHGFRIISAAWSWMLLLAFTVTPISNCGDGTAEDPPAFGGDSAVAARVADWVRSAAPVSAGASHFSVIGTLNFNSIRGESRDFIIQAGPAAFYRDSGKVAKAADDLRQGARLRLPALAAGGIGVLRDVQTFPWGMLQPTVGDVRLELTDTIVLSAEEHGFQMVGTTMPYADWDLASRGQAAEICQHFLEQDFYYLAHGGAMDRYVDLDAFIQTLERAVERYDGDGVDDAPGLQTGIRYWQIGNEPEGPDCGGFREDPAAFVELMRRAYTAVHRACPSCQVLNGGAGIPLWKEGQVGGGSFWSDYAALGGAEYIDVIAVHYNDGKVDGGDIGNLETQILRLRELLGREKPVWLTEFGALVEFGGQFLALPEAEAGAWYVRFYTAGMAAGASRFFSDSAAFIGEEGKRLLPFYVNKLLEEKLRGLTQATKIAQGQYLFQVAGKTVFVLWAGVPSGLAGTVEVTDLYGNSSTLDASQVVPSELSPLIVEPQ